MKLCAEKVGQNWLVIVKGPRRLGPNRDIINDCDTLVGVVAVRTIYRTASMPQKAYLSPGTWHMSLQVRRCSLVVNPHRPRLLRKLPHGRSLEIPTSVPPLGTKFLERP